MLRNEIYKGDRLLQKAPHTDVMTHRPEKGTEYKSYYVTDDHEPIVSKELWNKVQERLDLPMQDRTIRNKNSHYLRGKIICGECGSPFVRITSKNREEKFKSWICTDRRAGKKGKGCKCPIIREEKLLDLIDEDEECIEKIVIWKDGRYAVEAA